MATRPGREGRRPSERRRTPLSRVLLSLVGTFALAGLLVAGVALWGFKTIHDPGPLSAPKTVIIEEGRRTPEIAALLKREGVIDNETLFTVGAYVLLALSFNAMRIQREPELIGLAEKYGSPG